MIKLQRSIIVDSNQLAEDKFKGLLALSGGVLPIVIPDCILTETYRHVNIAESAFHNFNHMKKNLDNIFFSSHQGGLIAKEIAVCRPTKRNELIEYEFTDQFKNIIKNGIWDFHMGKSARFSQLVEREKSKETGIFNPQRGKKLLEMPASQIINAIKNTKLGAQYRNKTRDSWINGPLDYEVINACALWVKKSLLMNKYFVGLQVGGVKNFILQCPLLSRSISALFIRRFILESGNSFNQIKDKSVNEVIDVEYCILASYGRIAATSDGLNIATIRHLAKVVEVMQKKVSRDIEFYPVARSA